jgi:DNA polymerase III subunit epsilon
MAQCARQAGDARLKRFFAAWSLAPSMPLAEAPLVGLDIETTGLDANRHSIVSIGTVPFTLERIFFSRRRHWLLKPRFPLEQRSVTLHHITHSDLAHAPDLNEVLADVLEALSGRLPVVHYRNIERSFIESAVQHRLGESLLFPVIDTMALEARFYRQAPLARIRQWLGGQPVSVRLHQSRQRYGLPAYLPHHAVIDALATAELFQAQVAAHLGPDRPIGELWC